jgi:predicted nuclease of predicted toxin-antitoxin system
VLSLFRELLHAFKENRILLTHDRGDFGELIFRYHKPHCGVILFRRIRSGDLEMKHNRLLFVLEHYKNQLDQFWLFRISRGDHGIHRYI